VNGENVMTQGEYLALTQLLLDTEDEGVSKYFDIYLIEVQGKRTPSAAGALSFEQQVEMVLANPSIVGQIETLVDCKLTKLERDVPEKNTVVSKVDFKYSYKLPR
jgi:uncharacterized protein YjbK